MTVDSSTTDSDPYKTGLCDTCGQPIYVEIALDGGNPPQLVPGRWACETPGCVRSGIPAKTPPPAALRAIVCMSRCWSCMHGECFDPPQPHTWMDDDDAEYAGLPGVPSAAQHPCACSCARGAAAK